MTVSVDLRSKKGAGFTLIRVYLCVSVASLPLILSACICVYLRLIESDLLRLLAGYQERRTMTFPICAPDSTYSFAIGN